MTSQSGAAGTVREAPRGRVVAARLTAVGAALFWGVAFFGIVDLSVVPTQDEGFFQFYVLETSWGLLYTVLVMVPLLLWARDPFNDVLLQQVLAVALGVVVSGVAARAVGQGVAGTLLAVSALVPAALAGHSLRPRHRLRVRDVNRWLGALALVALAGSIVFAAAMIRFADAGAPDDNTWELMHLPMQAAFGLALAGSAVVAVGAGPSSHSRWRLPFMPAAVSAVWFGAVSVLYPDHVGSLGTLAGAACAGWGIAFGLGALVVPAPVTG